MEINQFYIAGEFVAPNGKEKIDLIKAIYKIPQQEICNEIDSSIVTFSNAFKRSPYIEP